VLAEASTASAAQAWLREHGCDLVLLDVQMPGPDGLMLAEALRHHARPPLVVFVTAHARHAVEAFELDAVDYLTKPVRLERLQAALGRVAQRLQEREALQARTALQQDEQQAEEDVLPINDRGRVLRVPVAEVLYLKAELKYLTVRTATDRYVMDGTLNDWEQRLGARFLRIHRNALGGQVGGARTRPPRAARRGRGGRRSPRHRPGAARRRQPDRNLGGARGPGGRVAGRVAPSVGQRARGAQGLGALRGGTVFGSKPGSNRALHPMKATTRQPASWAPIR
jgi:DNA-binding LytR/AlgR family response regulator